MKRLSIGNDRLKERRADTFETFYVLPQTEYLNNARKSRNILRDFNLFAFRFCK